ncbi:ATP-binding protein [Tsuneonella sp. CC-YZS046]|uniref:ATP-binding protein n=1 Tax=Tsuneonella sp. CC-YZS046 TaxID=3042152 RepID=UPI002D785E4A|nr:ATP-binding protein [Tsuneonella sp. CC-YZS046]WRO66223.1 ATP-binding protein [Tsuneonella sp. CC-YZS046]
MRLLRGIGLGGRLLAIVLVVVVIDFMVNTILFERVSSFALREDDVERIAEHLVIAQRVIEGTPPADRRAVAQELSTERIQLAWSPSPLREVNRVELATLRQQMLAFEPELSGSDLRLNLIPLSNTGDIGGSILLTDASVINFRMSSRGAWSLNLGNLLALTLPSLLLLLLAWLLFRATLTPLRTLVRATSEVGAGDPQPLEEAGQAEVRHLIRAFNAMQERIHQLLASSSQTLLAIGHDLRTPLARLQLRVENAAIEPAALHEIMRDIDEMRDLLQSLQTFVESGEDRTPAALIDIAATAQTLVDNARDQGGNASYAGPQSLEILARPVWIRRALSNLVENALLYAGNARVEVRKDGKAVEIAVEDDGPGIPEDRLVEVLRPFIRLDNARARNTAGMGLGLPIVDRAVKTEGGILTLANIPSGGLRVTMRLPRALS